ncbi:MAG: rhodanese-like domain-containing protein [Desulfohalobiaceae bacterium]
MGYENVVVYPFGNQTWVDEGYKQWSKEDLEQEAAAKEEPKKEDKQEASADIQEGEFPGSVDPDYLEEVLRDNPDSVQIIDVRDKEEFSQGHLPTAKRMDIDEIEAKIDEFDTSDKPIVLVCSTGARSGEAYFLFEDMRPELDVYYLDANISYGSDGFEIEQP